jgi:hypothetical protein
MAVPVMQIMHYYNEFAPLVSPPFETIAYDQRDCGGSVLPGEHTYTLRILPRKPSI